MHKLTIQLIILVTFSVTCNICQAQSFKKVLGMPRAALAPVKGVDISIYQPDRGADEGWVVISDRANNPLFLADCQTPNGRKMTFREHAWVVEQLPEKTGEWLHLVKASVTGTRINGQTEDLGWIHRSKVLLWKNSLRNAVSNIRQKVITINNLDNLKRSVDNNQCTKVNVYDWPGTSPQIDDLLFWEFYFVYQEENDYCLVGRQNNLSIFDLDQQLVGWVHKRQLISWSTKMALEPNFEEAAFEERQANPGFRLSAYSSAYNAGNHASGAKTGSPIWKEDPVTLNGKYLIDRRLPGNIMRFPVLQSYGNVCRTLIGRTIVQPGRMQMDSIDELMYANAVAEKNRMIKDWQRFDIIFLVEGSGSMQAHKDDVIKLVESVKASVPPDALARTAVAIYRDEPAGDKNLFQCTALSEETGVAVNFLKTASFENFGDYDTWTSMYYGIQQSLYCCNVVREHTTIMIIVGNYGDFSKNRDRVEVSTGKKTRVDRGNLSKTLADLNINLFAIQPQHHNDLVSQSFTMQTRKLIEEAAQTSYTGYRGLNRVADRIVLPTPYMSDAENLTEYQLISSAFSGGVVRAQKDSILLPEQMKHVFKTFMNEVNNQYQKNSHNLDQLLSECTSLEEICGDTLDGALAATLIRIQEKQHLTERDIRQLIKRKYRFFYESYIPTQIKGARYPAVSYVLLMSEQELSAYINMLEALTRNLDGPAVSSRQVVYDWLIHLVEIMCNETNIQGARNERNNNGALIDMTIQELKNNTGFNLIQELDLPADFTVADLLSPRRFSDHEVAALAERIINSNDSLRKIYRKRDTHSTVFQSNGIDYFWVPVKNMY